MRIDNSLLIVDDHPFVRHALRTLLRREASVDVIEEASCLLEGIEMARRHPVGLALLDLDLPETQGIDTVAYFMSALPTQPTAAMSTNQNVAMIDHVFRHGGRGFLEKDSPPPLLAAAVRLMLLGGRYFPELWFASYTPGTLGVDAEP